MPEKLLMFAVLVGVVNSLGNWKHSPFCSVCMGVCVLSALCVPCLPLFQCSSDMSIDRACASVVERLMILNWKYFRLNLR